MPVELAVLDANGMIVFVNEAWKRFARENGSNPAWVSCGVNYLEVCRRAAGAGDEQAARAARAIEGVLRGASGGEQLEYACDSPRETRSFLMSITPLADNEAGAVVVHSDISQLKAAEHAIRQALAEVERLKSRIHQDNTCLPERTRAGQSHIRVVGQSKAIRQVLTQAQQVAATDSTVLLLGETGTGKELIASTIHDLSRRRDRPLVSVNCAIMPAALVESELFGREKGAFTGSLARQIGRFELADRSTIFLDEVAELPPEVQAKLLRVLETRQIERLGNPKPVPVDVRIIAATNRDLEQSVAQGKFRQDLYYRLNVFPITLPALRERREDVPLLVWAFVEEFTKTFNKNIESIDHEVMSALKAYEWPGNIRELRNLVERAMIVARGPKLQIQLPAASALSAPATPQKLEDVDREHVLGVLERSGWRIRGPNGAALKLGLRPTTLEARMAKLGIHRPRSVATD